MKKTIIGLLFTGIILGACSTNDKEYSYDPFGSSEASSTTETTEYKTKELSNSDIEKIQVGDDKNSVLTKLGKPLKEWDTDFLYEELDNAVKRDELIVTLMNDSDHDLAKKHKELASSGKKAADIDKLTMFQYTLSKDSDGTFLVWISPKTDKVVYLNERSYIDEYGETSDSDSETYDSSSSEKIVYQIGQTASFSSDDGSSIDVTITNVSKSEGDGTFHIPSGVYYAKVDFTVKNTGTTPFDANAHYLEFYDSKDLKAELDSWDYFSETVQAGKSVEGTAYFDVTSEGDTFEVYFSDSSWAGSYN